MLKRLLFVFVFVVGCGDENVELQSDTDRRLDAGIDQSVNDDAGNSDVHLNPEDMNVSDMQPTDADMGVIDMAPDLPPTPLRCEETVLDGNVACAGSEPSTTEHFLISAAECGFGLRPPTNASITERRQLIQAIADKSGGIRTIQQVMSNLNRSGRAGINSDNAYRLRNHNFRGFRWNTGDENVSYWYPQGVTGSSDAVAGGKIAGRDLVMVSWYHNSDDRPTKGVRISIADVTNLNNVTYRHLLLVEPTGTPDAPNFRSAQTGSGGALHAGGIVWWEDFLYVADTTGGFRVYDLTSIMRTNNADTNRIGISGDQFDGLGYAYVVPELFRYRRNNQGCTIRFSFVGLDRSSNPPALISGEYRSDDHNGRIIAWDVDAETGMLATDAMGVRPSAAYVSGQTRMQGAMRYEGNIYISSSSQYQRYGRLYRTKPGFGESSITAWVYGAEDLYMQREQDIIWTAAEFPGNRDVVGIPLVRP